MDNPEAVPQPAAASNDDEPVVVFDTQEESEAWVVKGLLDSAGIPALITGLDAPQDVLPGVGGVVVRVNPDQAEEATRIIEEYRASGDAIEEEGEGGDLNEEPDGEKPA